ncbi:hypothetical protein EUA79_00465 [TM7 phylum sp. oral taxon 351]|nr:hypothetical protein EUA79_00465 [TM7 phylum sp. oral taxon 351]
MEKENNLWKIVGFVILCVAGWYLFVRPKEHYIGITDARKYWSDSTSVDNVVYCGTDGRCSDIEMSKATSALVKVANKEKDGNSWLYEFIISYPPTQVVAEGRCDRSGYKSIKRRCVLTSTTQDGSIATWMIFPIEN